jgi:hypothetical protein
MLFGAERSSGMSDEMIKEIYRILRKGNTVEIKKENGKIVLVEIQRKAKMKAPVISQE